jgi:hypothetical protein
MNTQNISKNNSILSQIKLKQIQPQIQQPHTTKMQTRSMTRAIQKQQQQKQQQPIRPTYPIEPTSIFTVGLPCVIS